MFDRLPSALIHYTWQTYLCDLPHLLVLCTVCKSAQYALAHEYRRFVRYRMLLSDPRCINYTYFNDLLHCCDFKQLKQARLELHDKFIVPEETFDILFALTMTGPTPVFALDIAPGRTLCFSRQHSRTVGGSYIKCIEFPKLLLVLDCRGGVYPTVHVGAIPFALLELLRDPVRSLWAHARDTGKCALCNRLIAMKPCHKINPGLGLKCFRMYRHTLHRIKQPIVGGVRAANALVGFT